MQKASLVSRYLLGIIFLVFGLNGFLKFLPMPALPESAMVFMGGLGSSGYFFPLLKGTEVLMGLFLVLGFAVPFAYIVLAPITINIFLFHAVLTPGLQNLILPLFLIALSLLGASAYWDVYRALFITKK
jgi:putative oxidoreductase